MFDRKKHIEQFISDQHEEQEFKLY